MEDEISYCPSFSCYSCGGRLPAAAAVATPDVEDDFEFLKNMTTITDPNEIERGGQLVFPLFSRNVSMHHRVDESASIEQQQSSFSSSSSEADDSEIMPEGSYSVWSPNMISPSSVIGASPSPRRCQKSYSTGSSDPTTKRRWRLRDLLRRSRSDGKLLVNQKGVTNYEVKLGEKRDEKAKSSIEAAYRGRQVSAHEIFYRKSKALKEGEKRKSYLPYRQDIVGFFSNVNGYSRTFTPF
ncbi:hypothetical protein LINPERHAP1_LOCUS24563 [Linum perenne]